MKKILKVKRKKTRIGYYFLYKIFPELQGHDYILEHVVDYLEQDKDSFSRKVNAIYLSDENGYAYSKVDMDKPYYKPEEFLNDQGYYQNEKVVE